MVTSERRSAFQTMPKQNWIQSQQNWGSNTDKSTNKTSRVQNPKQNKAVGCVAIRSPRMWHTTFYICQQASCPPRLWIKGAHSLWLSLNPIAKQSVSQGILDPCLISKSNHNDNEVWTRKHWGGFLHWTETEWIHSNHKACTRCKC